MLLFKLYWTIQAQRYGYLLINGNLGNFKLLRKDSWTGNIYRDF